MDETESEIEIPREAYPFVIGYLTTRHPDTAREAVDAWRQSEIEFQKLREARKAERVNF